PANLRRLESRAGRARTAFRFSCEELPIIARPLPDVGRLEQIGDHREEIGARRDELRRVIERDAADRGERHAEGLGLLKQAKGCTHRVWFGRRGKYAAKSDVIRSCLDCSMREHEIVVARTTKDATF